MAEQVWCNGTVLEASAVRLSPFDHGLLTGDGVFETMKVYGGRPFALRRHLERLDASAAGMGLDPPDHAVLRRAVDDVVAANAIDMGRVRITLTGGPSPLGSERGSDGPTILVAATPLAAWPPVTDVVVVPWPRNERGALAGLKTTSYGENVVALAHARDRGAGEALFANTVGDLCEGTGTNVFVVLGGRILTPPLSSGCLAGVTRALVLEITDAVEETMPVSILGDADEIFLTSTTREVQPVGHVDGRPVPGAPGPATTATAEAFNALVERTMDP